MSTNYYAFGPFPGGDADSEGLHIGQHVGGWEFLWRAHDNPGVICTDTWRKFLDAPGVTIRTEAGVEVPLEDFWRHATLRPAQAGLYQMRARTRSIVDWRDQRGCPFSQADFF
ncbi:hypothetical protein ACWF76_05630 [Streptomyces globisporus]